MDDRGRRIAVLRDYLRDHPEDREATLALARFAGWSADYPESQSLFRKLLREQPELGRRAMGLLVTVTALSAVLAAGSASRFGSTKQLADIDGSPMVRHALDAASQVCGEHTLLVTGHDSAAVARACAGLGDGLTADLQSAQTTGLDLAARVVVLTPPAGLLELP